MIKKTRWPVIFLFSIACVDQIDLQLDSVREKLVVDGIITDEPGPKVIRIGRSLPFDNTEVLPAYFQPECQAVAVIEDADGNSMPLTETSPGHYSTVSDFQAIIGTAYTLKITTSDGKRYHSKTEVVTSTPAPDSLFQEYIVYDRLVKNAAGNFVSVKSTGFKLYVRVPDDPIGQNYYRWEVDGIFEFFSVIDDPTMKQCWAPVSRLESHIVIGDDHFSQGRAFQQELAIIPYDRPSYFLAIVRQYSLSPGAYSFWSRLKDQQLNTGSIFDPAPAPIVGNITCLDDVNEEVLGYFGASSVVERTFLINRFKASGLVSPSPYKKPMNGDCRLHEVNATNIKPAGFP